MQRAIAIAAAGGLLAGAASAGTVVQLDFDESPLTPLETLDDQFLLSHFIDFNGSAIAVDVFGDPEAHVTGMAFQAAFLHMTSAPGFTFSDFVFDLEIFAGQTVTVEFYANGQLLHSNQYTDPLLQLGSTLFDGIDDFAHLTGVDEIWIYDSGFTFRVDDLNYTVTAAPLPHAGVLGAAGLFALAGVCRRR